MKRRYVVIVGLTLFLSTLGVACAKTGDETVQLKQQIKALESKLAHLETQLANQQQAPKPAMKAWRQSPSFYMDEWDPFTEMDAMHRYMNQLMHHAMGGMSGVAFNPKTDIKQTDEQYTLTLDIPGMDKNNLNIEVKDGSLLISGERSSEKKEDRPNQYVRQERSFGYFSQAFPLPEDAKPDAIDAKYDNGVLTVVIGREKQKDGQDSSKKVVIK